MTAELIAPAAATELRLDAITVSGRHRKDLGDIKALAESIDNGTLLQPVGVTPDHQLVFGERRLEAVRSLGWETVPVTVIHNLADATARLRAERDENTCRKDFTPSEMLALGRQLDELERPKAKNRQGTRRDLTSGSAEPEVVKRSSDAVGEALGISRGTYERLKRVDDATRHDDEGVREVAREQMAKLDAGQTCARKADDIVREKKKLVKPQPTPKPEKSKGDKVTTNGIGKSNQRHQMNALTAMASDLEAKASVLEGLFQGGIQKTCTPEIRDTRIADIRGAWRRIDSVLKQIKPTKEEIHP